MIVFLLILGIYIISSAVVLGVITWVCGKENIREYNGYIFTPTANTLLGIIFVCAIFIALIAKSVCFLLNKIK